MSEFREHKIEWNDQKISRLWDFYSNNYPYNQMYFTKVFGKDILKKTEKVIGKLDGKIILDFGCGPAFSIDNIMELNIKPARYIGLDFSEKSIDVIKNKPETNFEKQGIFVQVLPSKIESNSIDVCFLIEVIEHLNDDYLDATLKEIQRVLKPNGKLIITTPNNENLELSKTFCPDCGSIFHKWQHVRVWNKELLKSTIVSYGFSDIKIIETNLVSNNSILRDIFIIFKGILKNNKSNLIGIFEKN